MILLIQRKKKILIEHKIKPEDASIVMDDMNNSNRIIVLEIPLIEKIEKMEN